MIVKVQKELSGGNKVLTYNKSRDIFVQIEMPESETNKIFEKGEYKKFCTAKLEKGMLKITGIAGWQEW
jgi:hypothetical protein